MAIKCSQCGALTRLCSWSCSQERRRLSSANGIQSFRPPILRTGLTARASEPRPCVKLATFSYRELSLVWPLCLLVRGTGDVEWSVCGAAAVRLAASPPLNGLQVDVQLSSPHQEASSQIAALCQAAGIRGSLSASHDPAKQGSQLHDGHDSPLVEARPIRLVDRW
ncbi:hypothetical protein GQ53DRAFT_17443 [Thozetella sp. PMI_491]|nr:hypothetical protein GQ53DRAFT_17443 [Thozetella sp. PMI_491]